MRSFVELSADLPRPVVVLAIGLALVAVCLLFVESARQRAGARVRYAIAGTGVVATALLLLAVLRPVRVSASVERMGPKVVVLVDASRSMDLKAEGGAGATRRNVAREAIERLLRSANGARLELFTFSTGAAKPLSLAAPERSFGAAYAALPALSHSNLSRALESVALSNGERPASIVVISDGRLDQPGDEGVTESVTSLLGPMKVPVHTVAAASEEPRDAAIREVRTAGAVVAHQPAALRIEIACSGGLSCSDIPVVVRELRDTEPPTQLASGTAHLQNGFGVVELAITLDRAGKRIVEIEIPAVEGDTVVENNRRLVPIQVTRDRIRLLHVAGRPTYDVRALRMWLKSDASVDVIAFFILRTATDEVGASPDELALIPFPVDELFTDHLSSFDAVILQDFNAEPYGLSKHLKSLAQYVQSGGGLIMVGGPEAFIPGNYGDTPLGRVLPVSLKVDPGSRSGIDLGSFVPHFTEIGQTAPILAPLRELLGVELPPMPGCNVVGDLQPWATALLVHPVRKTITGNPMPVLAVGEVGSGRSIALGVDGSHRLLFSSFAANAAGRAHGAFWDAMLGWLMKDPRFEPVHVELQSECIAGSPVTLKVDAPPDRQEPTRLQVLKLGTGAVLRESEVDAAEMRGGYLDLGAFEPGGYAVRLSPARSAAATGTRMEFACEFGGDEWADSRPDAARLERIATATGGTFVRAADTDSIPIPPGEEIASERTVTAVLPAWVWSLSAATVLGLHWIVRRKLGLV